MASNRGYNLFVIEKVWPLSDDTRRQKTFIATKEDP